jgi:serine/threonine protein kinase
LNILYKLKHKNIIGFYGMHEIKKNELDCLIMEYAKFGNIRDFQKNTLKKKDLSEQLLCFFAFQILNGLKYCHKCKVAHLDIKPQNIIIDDYLTLKIIDFSVSLDYRRIKSNKIKLPFRGTNFYMAPEVIQEREINIIDLNKVDLYSLGVILYFYAFYSYPYNLNSEDANDYDKINNKIKNNPLTFNNKDNDYSIFFIDFITKLLEKDIDI